MTPPMGAARDALGEADSVGEMPYCWKQNREPVLPTPVVPRHQEADVVILADRRKLKRSPCPEKYAALALNDSIITAQTSSPADFSGMRCRLPWRI
jgi:hypothetical protein